MEKPKKNNPEKGAKSYKSLWIAECIFWCLIPTFVIVKISMRDHDWMNKRIMVAVPLMYIMYFILLTISYPGLLSDYRGLIRQGKIEHKCWKLLSLIVMHTICLLILSYIVFIFH